MRIRQLAVTIHVFFYSSFETIGNPSIIRIISAMEYVDIE